MLRCFLIFIRKLFKSFFPIYSHTILLVLQRIVSWHTFDMASQSDTLSRIACNWYTNCKGMNTRFRLCFNAISNDTHIYLSFNAVIPTNWLQSSTRPYSRSRVTTGVVTLLFSSRRIRKLSWTHPGRAISLSLSRRALTKPQRALPVESPRKSSLHAFIKSESLYQLRDKNQSNLWFWELDLIGYLKCQPIRLCFNQCLNDLFWRFQIQIRFNQHTLSL